MKKKSPDTQKLQEILHSSKLVRGSFLGTDRRGVLEIIDADAAEMARLGVGPEVLAGRMQEITDLAQKSLGNWVKIDNKRQAMTQEARGNLVCPWPHPAKFAKRVTTVKMIDSDKSIQWADLNIHLIAKHGFFEGRGSAFRIEPAELIDMIF